MLPLCVLPYKCCLCVTSGFLMIRILLVRDVCADIFPKDSEIRMMISSGIWNIHDVCGEKLRLWV